VINSLNQPINVWGGLIVGAFLDNEKAKVSATGQFTMPSTFRDELGSSFVMLPMESDMGSFIVCYKRKYYENILFDLLEQGEDTSDLAMIASVITCDNQGRVTIPQKLRKDRIKDPDITLIGNVDKIEIWNTSDYLANNDRLMNKEKLKEAGEKLRRLPFKRSNL